MLLMPSYTLTPTRAPVPEPAGETVTALLF